MNRTKLENKTQVTNDSDNSGQMSNKQKNGTITNQSLQLSHKIIFLPDFFLANILTRQTIYGN